MKTNITKKIILGTIISVGLFSAAKAQTAYDDQEYNNNQQPQQQYTQPAPQYTQPAPQVPVYGDQSFYYYPDANVYYDINCNRYIYNNGYGWVTVNILPAGFDLYNAPRFMVYHRGPQIWLDNAIHIRNFYRPVNNRPIVAYNNFRRDDFRRNDFGRNDFRRDVRVDNRGGDRGGNHGGRGGRGGRR